MNYVDECSCHLGGVLVLEYVSADGDTCCPSSHSLRDHAQHIAVILGLGAACDNNWDLYALDYVPEALGITCVVCLDDVCPQLEAKPGGVAHDLVGMFIGNTGSTRVHHR